MESTKSTWKHSQLSQPENGVNGVNLKTESTKSTENTVNWVNLKTESTKST